MGPQSALCNRFGVGHYPTLKFGRAGDFGGGDALLEELSGGRSAKDVIQWAGKQLATCGHKPIACLPCQIIACLGPRTDQLFLVLGTRRPVWQWPPLHDTDEVLRAP